MTAQHRPAASEARIVAEDGAPTYVRVEPAPRVGRSGLYVAVRIQAADPVLDPPRAQVALAHAEHATGWSIGLDPHGRASLVAGTRSGPAVLRVGDPLEAGRWYELVARIPGPESDRMELSVQSEDGVVVEGAVRVGAPVVNAGGPLLWGCRSLYDGVRPELTFTGRVADVLIAADATASGSRDILAADPRRAIRWPQESAVG